MKKEVDCGVIRDLLPLYEDGVASEESQEMVRAHLKECADCREELRKMRTPVSVPPDEDEEAVKRFLERRAEHQRKRNIKLACIVVPLALLVVFSLCYTLIPRSWNSVGGSVEPDRIMGNHHVFTIQSGTPDIDLWNIVDDQNAKMVDELMHALQTASYRGELRNVLNYTPLASLFQDTSVTGSDGAVNLFLIKDNQVVVTVSLFDTDDHLVQIWTEQNPNTFFYHVDGEMYDALAALVEKYGEHQG